MASTIYYGKSITAGNIQTKQVILKEIPSFQPGDILSVYFAYGNLIDGPTLIITNGDVNENNSISNDTGLNILAPGQGAAVIGSWTDGEVVNFSYTENPSNVFAWELIGKSVATDTIYGGVLLDADSDNSAISVGEVKRLLANTTVGSISYESRDVGVEASPIGDLTLASYNPTTGETSIQTATIEIPYIYVPTNISYFENDEGYVKEASARVTNGILFNSEDNNYDTLKVGDETNSSIVIDLNNYGGLDLYPLNGETTNHGDLTVVDGVINGIIDTDEASQISNLTSDTITVNENLIVNGISDLDTANVNSLNISNTPVDTYISNKIEEDFLKHAYRIFEAGAYQHVKWTWHYAQGINLSVNDRNTAVDLGDCGEVGYRTIGIISWEVSNTIYAGQVNLFGFYWKKSETTGLNDHLYAKVYNHGPKEIVDLKISVLVLLMRCDSFETPLLQGTNISFSDYIDTNSESIEIENPLQGTLDGDNKFNFDGSAYCNWGSIKPTVINIGDTSYSGEAIETFISNIYQELYINKTEDKEIRTIIKYQKEQYQLICYILDVDSNTYQIKLRSI